MKKKDIYRERYQYLRAKGYSPTEARKLRTHAIDMVNNTKVTPEIKIAQKPPKEVKRVYAPKEKTPVVNTPEEKKLTVREKKKIKYWIYRKLGYSSKEASAKGYGDIDFGNIKMNKDGTVPVTSKVFQHIKNDVWIDKQYIKYKEKFDKVENDTVYSPWGMMTHDKRYKDETERLVTKIRKNHNLSNDQAHYFLYFMYQNNISYDRAKRELLSNRDFEMYDKIKAMRNSNKPGKKKRGKAV